MAVRDSNAGYQFPATLSPDCVMVKKSPTMTWRRRTRELGCALLSASPRSLCGGLRMSVFQHIGQLLEGMPGNDARVM